MRSLKFDVVRFLPLALLTPLSALCVGSIAQANHVSPAAVEVLDLAVAQMHDKNIASIDGLDMLLKRGLNAPHKSPQAVSKP